MPTVMPKNGGLSTLCHSCGFDYQLNCLQYIIQFTGVYILTFSGCLGFYMKKVVQNIQFTEVCVLTFFVFLQGIV